jgi:uncharacterized protein
MPSAIATDAGWISAFCQRHDIRKLALFGSVLRQDFRPDSDVDVLIEFSPSATVSLFGLVRIRDELSEYFGREVDLVDERGLRNPYRRREILRTAETLYAA